MFFKLESVLNDLTLSFYKQDSLTLASDDDSIMSVTIRPLTANEKGTHDGDGPLSIALTQEEPTGDLLAIFERLANNQMPEGFKKPKTTNSAFVKYEDEEEGIDNEGRIKEGCVPAARMFPEYFQAFASELHIKLWNCTKRAVKILRWRKVINISHNPIRSLRGMYWSFDGQEWHRMPESISCRMSIEAFSDCSPKLKEEIESLIRTDANEPLGHELFLEAWQNINTNPRSALIIGIAAAEIGFKQCVGKLVPDAKWLITECPSPPLTVMLSRYLPTLPSKLKIQDKVLRPPATIRKALADGIEARNHTIHAGVSPPNGEALEKILLSVRDLLYLLDYYCGFNWAFDNIRHEVQEEMVKELNRQS
ncbi:MAG: hypothetical protein L0220_04450 [Acidobacteria bacterium]|nr:hypothetical protein [Acidobacteriota bacterium]